MRRRDFIKTIVGSTVTLPFGARAQQADRMRRIGVLHGQGADNSESRARIAAFRQSLEQLGWTDGRNVRIDYRWGGGSANDTRTYAAELVALGPDVILTNGAAVLAPLLQATNSVPIVFVLVADPVGAGFIDSLARPGGNATGFTAIEYGFGGKYLELLKEIAPGTTRAAVIRDPVTSVGNRPLRSDPKRGAIGQSRGESRQRARCWRDRTYDLFVRTRLEWRTNCDRKPFGVRSSRPNHRAGSSTQATGSLSLSRLYHCGRIGPYGPDTPDQYRRAAGYVDRILKGEKPADLPVQAPTKYELVINLKTAKMLGLAVPPSLLGRADEIVE